MSSDKCNCPKCHKSMRCTLLFILPDKSERRNFTCDDCDHHVTSTADRLCVVTDKIVESYKSGNPDRDLEAEAMRLIIPPDELRQKLYEIAEAIKNKPIPQFEKGGIVHSIRPASEYVHPNCKHESRQTSTKRLIWNAVKREMIENLHNKERLERLKKLLRDTEDSGAYELCRPILNNIIDLEIKVLISDSIIEY